MIFVKHLLLVAFISFPFVSIAQRNKQTENKVFNHLDIALTAGTTGLGIELATPLGRMLQLRTGYSFMPEFSPIMTFDIQVGSDPTISQQKFKKLASILEKFTGYEINESIDMKGDPNFHNWSVLVDLFPFKNNKRWHFTAGFYLGSSTIAEAYNTTEDMPSLMAVDIYNNIYDFFIEDRYWDTPIYNDFYLDPNVADIAKEKLQNYGRMGMNMGNYFRDIKDENGNTIHHKGDAYIMTPDENGMVKAKMKVNMFKPYVGFGYGGNLIKNNNNIRISFNCGIMMWGGAPKILTHDGIDLINDVKGTRGKVGCYVDVLEHLKIYPVLNLHLAYRLL